MVIQRAGQCSQARQVENDFGLRLDWGLCLCEALLGWVLARSYYWWSSPPCPLFDLKCRATEKVLQGGAACRELLSRVPRLGHHPDTPDTSIVVSS